MNTLRQAAQQALEALKSYGSHAPNCDHLVLLTSLPPQRKPCSCGLGANINALRAALAEPEHHDPIGDAQDKLIAEQVASHDYRTRYDRGCYKCGSHYCPADCLMPTHLVPQQPQMQPCAGRNCGSTNPNLHSAECFEDYEKTTGMSSVEHAVIAGAMFDLMGWLTSRKERIVLSSADNASPAVEAITEFAKMRGLSLADAKVTDWQDMMRGNDAYAEMESKYQALLRVAINALMDMDNGLVVHEGHWRTRQHVAVSKIKECLK